VSERLLPVPQHALGGVRAGGAGGGAPRAGVRGQRPREIFFGPTYFRRFRADILPTYYRRADIFPGRHISGTT
jgi:hypothetical protein